MLSMLKNIGTPEIIFIAAVIVLLFGSTKLPELGRGLGDAVKQLRKAFGEGEEKNSKPWI